MSSRTEIPLDVGSSQKLPVINESRSLVSPGHSSRSRSTPLKDQVDAWAVEIRERLNKAVLQQAVVDENDALLLKQELVAVFINALQKDNRHSWSYLREVLIQVSPYSEILRGKKDLKHYLERILHHVQIHQERLFDLQVTETLSKVFPKDVADILNSNTAPKRNFQTPVPPPTKVSISPSLSTRSPRHKPGPKFHLPDGSLPYQLMNNDDSWLKPKGVTLSDIRGSLADVAWETATREAIWTACLGSTAVTLNTDLYDEPVPETPRPLVTPRSPQQSPEVAEIMKKLEQMSQNGDDAGPSPGEKMTGRQAVEYFSKCFHTGEIKFMYFNIAPNRHYRPYDLVAVPKDKTNKEHYVFSTFGVLHVYQDQPAENMSLADWQREAVLYRAISNIPLFKNYLQLKIFNRWRANRHFADFARTRHKIGLGLIRSVPSLNAALLQIYKLCHELLHLRLLPLDDEKCYQLLEFENGINYMNRQADKVLERFFRYNKVIVDTTAEELYKKVRHCEVQAKQKTVFSKDSLHIQKMKREERERNLRIAKEEMHRLGTFVRLIDQMLVSHLVALSRASITSFVRKTMQAGLRSLREGLFHAILVFTPKDVLSLSPPKEKFVNSLGRTLANIPELCCRSAEDLGGETRVPEMKDEEDEDLDSANRPLLSSRNASLSSHRRDSKHINQVLDSLRDRRVRKSLPGRTTRMSGIEKLIGLDKPSSETSLLAEELISTPDLNREATPSKRDDDLGQLTPSMVVSGNEELLIEGHSLLTPYKPLSSANLEDKILRDEACQAALIQHQRLMQEAIEEIDEFCETHIWLHGIQTFCKSWNEKSVHDWEGAAAFTIEQKLNEIRQWIEKVRGVEKSFVTENRIFYVDCSGIHETLVPKLSQIFRELCMFVAEESVRLAKAFSTEMSTVTEALKEKETTIGGFALYAKNVSKCKQNTPQYKQRIEYIKSLFEVIRMSFRQLSSEEEKLEEKVWSQWEAFLSYWQDAMEFVNIQTPLITQNLEDTYQPPKEGENSDIGESSDIAINAAEDSNNFSRLEEESKMLYKSATTGKFLDPQQNPTQIIKELAKLQERFYDTKNQMQQASKWKEAITGDPYELEFLRKMSLDMNLRMELWKYVEVSTHTIRDWRNQWFKKFNVRKALDKVTEWLAAAGQLKDYMPRGDAVLTNWYRHLNEFRQDLPVLHKLSSVALKTRHWKVVFTNMGEQFDPNHQFVVDELLAYNLGTHASMIRSVHQAALSEFAVEQQLVKLQRTWQEKSFKVAKHIPDSVYKEDNTVVRSIDKKKRVQKSDKPTNTGRAPGIKKEELYVLIEVEELKYLLEDSQVALQMMLSSPYLVEHKLEAQQWAESLQEAEEMIDLWQEAQTKWLYLLKIFDDPELYRKLEFQSKKFEDVHTKFTEFMQLIVLDPKFTSILTKPRGDKSYRLLQGDRLRKMLVELVKTEEEILKKLDHVIDNARKQFTRLYFLSNSEMSELLSISRNPRALMPFVQKCFTGIKSLTFALPNQEQALNTTLDYELNAVRAAFKKENHSLVAHKLEVTTLHGDLGEALPLFDRLEAPSDAPRWLATLEMYMKTTVNTILEACVQARLEEVWGQPNQILEELEQIESMAPASSRGAEEMLQQIRQTYHHWLLRFPSQCVLNAEAIMWVRTVFWALENQDADELRRIRTNLSSRLDQYVKVLQENSYNNPISDTRLRLHCLLSCLINQGLHHRDVIDNLLLNENLSDAGYDWVKVLKYQMEINTVLRAKSEVDIDDEWERSKPATSANRRASEFRPRDDLGISRNMSMVQQGYQFGKCVVSQMGASFAYDCEYLGPTPRLAFTPLTERAYLNLTMALNTYHCGTLSGPPSSGKSETIRDLSKALGRHLVELNVSESLNISTMNRVLSGAVQSGCWMLLDHCDRMPQGLMSVFAQQLDYVCSALRVLDASSDNQYGIRGQPTVDKKLARGAKGDSKRIRRNSLTTLHSLPASDFNVGNLERQSTVPHGFNEDGLITYFEDTWVAEKERRHSVVKEINVRDSDIYKNNRPPPLFYEYVTMHRKKKSNFSHLAPNYAPYKPEYLGNILLNGHLVRANANYGCFMTINSANPGAWKIPENFRLLMRPCAMVKPDMKIIIEVFLYSNGFPRYKELTDKLNILFGLLKAQLPRRPQYDFGLKCVTTVLSIARQNYQDIMIYEMKRKKRQKAEVIDEEALAEIALIQAIEIVLYAKTENQDDHNKMTSVLHDVFPKSIGLKSNSPGPSKELIQAVEEQLEQDRLQPNKIMVDTIMQLYTAIQSKQSVVMLGPAGSGKTTCYKMLAKTLTTLHYGTPAEAKDEELVPERSLALQYKQKLKILKDIPARPQALSQPKLWQKMTKKSSLLQSTLTTLAAAVADEPEPVNYPKVDVETVYPSSYTPEEYPLVDVKVIHLNMFTYPELFGTFVEGKWIPGLIGHIMSNAEIQSEAARWMMDSHDDRKKGSSDTPSQIQKWIILDGNVDPAWVDTMATLYGDSRRISLANSQTINLQEATSLIFEVGDLANASPSVISQCAVLCCRPEAVSWNALFEAWGQTAKQRWLLSTAGWQVLYSLAKTVFSPTLSFIEKECSSSLSYGTGLSSSTNQIAPGLQQVTSFIRLIAAVLDRHLKRDDMEKLLVQDNAPNSGDRSRTPRSSQPLESGTPTGRLTSLSRVEDVIPNYICMIKCMFSFAYIWGFGGNLHDSSMEKFSRFARETLSRASHPIIVPDSGTVYDYYVDFKTGLFTKWSERTLERARGVHTHYTVLPEIDRYNFLVDMLLCAEQPILLTGAPGVGKTSLVEYLVQAKHPYTRINVSPGLGVKAVYSAIVSRVYEPRKNKMMGYPSPVGNQNKRARHMFFIDDLNTAPVDGGGSQPILELMRQVITLQCTYDRSRHIPLALPDINFLVAASCPGSPGSGSGYVSHVMSARLTRLFTVLTMFTPSETTLYAMHNKTVQTWLEEFPSNLLDHHTELARACVRGLLDVYRSVQEHLRATPARPHYVFTLHDLAHTVEGMLLLSPRAKAKPKPKPRARRAKDKELEQLNREKRATLAALGFHPPITELLHAQSQSLAQEGEEEMSPMLSTIRSITRLWCHECTRVFGDRIFDCEDQVWFEGLLDDVVTRRFCTSTEDSKDKMSTIPEDRQVQTALNVPTSVDAMSSRETTSMTGDELQSLKQDTALPPEEDVITPVDPSNTEPATNSSSGERMSNVFDGPNQPECASTPQDTTEVTTDAETCEEEEEEEEEESEESTETSSSEESSEETEEESTQSSSEVTEPSSSASKSKSKKPVIARKISVPKESPTKHRTPTPGRDSKMGTGSVISNRALSETPKKAAPHSKTPKRGVTFKTGLVDREIQRYSGPLLDKDQVRKPHESLTGFLFSRFINAMHANIYGVQAERGYSEGSVRELAIALNTCVGLYNSETHRRLELVFFEEAVRHITRIVRVLITYAGHALLLGMTYSTGRATLVRLAAHITSCKLFEPAIYEDHKDCRQSLHQAMKACSRLAALKNRPMVLLVKEDMGPQCIQDVCAFIKEGQCPGLDEREEGQCPGLYSTVELQNIATLMTPGQVKVTRVDKVEAAFNKFLLRVRQNLHVIICMNEVDNNGRSLQSRLVQYPVLLRQCCSIDVYHPWTYDAFYMVAKQWLSDARPCKIPVPWSENHRYEQTEMIASAMAYIHNSSKAALEKLHSHQPKSLNLISPLTFKEFVHSFRVISANIYKKEKAKMETYDAGLAKLNEAFESIASYRREVSNLVPKHQMAQAVVKEHVEFVEVHRGEYISALERCKEQEEIIDSLAAPLEQLKVEAHSTFENVKPTYFAAMEAVNSLDKMTIAEIKSFHSPPPAVVMVLEAICLLFGVPCNWTDAKELITRDNFFEQLEFYDKDHIPDKVFRKLTDYMNKPEFNPLVVMKTSLSAATLCKWIHALYKYAEISRAMKPRIKALEEAQEQANQAQALLGRKRVQANRIKSALEQRIQAHKESVKEAKGISKQIQALHKWYKTIERRISKANNLMEHMSSQNALWRQELKVCRGKIRTAPGDALLTAASVCYHGPLDNHSRAALMADWLFRCESGSFDELSVYGQEVKQLSVSAKLDSIIRDMSVDSLQSVQYGTPRDRPDPPSKVGDDGQIQDQERTSTATPQMAMYRHRPSICDTGVSHNTEIKVSDHINLHGPGKQASGTDQPERPSNLVAIRENYTLQEVLSTFDEQSDWKLRGFPTDIYSIHNTLITRTSVHNRPSSWPLLIDPDHQAELWIRVLQEGDNIIREKELFDVLPGRTSTSADDEESAFMNPEETVLGQSMSVVSDADGMTEGSTTPVTEMITPRSEHTIGRRLSDLNQASSELMLSTMLNNQSGNQSENIIKVSEMMEKPEHNLLITSADDPDLHTAIANSIVHGITLLITHLERQPLPPIFSRLLAKDYDRTEDGQLVVTIGSQIFGVHPDFALFLSTSVPLFLRGDGIHSVIHPNLAVIDLSVSQEGIIDTVLRDIMSVERPEFESQRCSIERDLIHHQQDLRREQYQILERTLNLRGALLEEPGMLEALIAYHHAINQNQMILEETRYLRDHLEEKRVPYTPVALHGAKLYEIIQRLSVLNPFYHLPLSMYINIFTSAIKSRHRGKGTQGAPMARARELIVGTTSAIHKFVSAMMFGPHVRLFSLLVTLEQLRVDEKLTDQELGLFVNGINTSLIEDSIVFDDKPDWLNNKVWLDCSALETTITAFNGLRQSFTNYSEQWQEYFKCEIDLIETVPDAALQDLTVFQRCLLWRICAPNKVKELSQALVLYEMGGILPMPEQVNIASVYEYADKATPVVLILPQDIHEEGGDPSIKGHMSVYPVLDLVQLSRDVDHDGKVTMVTCGVDTQMSEIENALQEAMTSGNWLVIRNAHLSQSWSRTILDLIKTIVYSKSDEEETDIKSLVEGSKEHVVTFTSLTTRGSHSNVADVHDDFRLFVTTQAGSERLVPGHLVQYGVKVTCEQTPDFKSTLLYTYHNLERLFSRTDRAALFFRKLYTHTDPIIPLAVFHSVLLSRRSFGKTAYNEQPYWTQTDLAAALEHLQVILTLCQRHRGVPDISSQIYGGHCFDLQDAALVECLANALLLSPKQLKELPQCASGVSALLGSVLPSGGELLEQKLERLVDVEPQQLSLSESADIDNSATLSRHLLGDLVRVCGAPALLSLPAKLSHKRAEIVLHDVKKIMSELSDLPEVRTDAYYPTDAFFQSENKLLRDLVTIVQGDVNLLLKVARGEIPGTPQSQKLLNHISQQKIPQKWLLQSFPNFQTLTEWAKGLSRRSQLLKSYQSALASDVTVFDLAVFCRPDRFLQSVLQTHARREFHDVNSLTIRTQLLETQSPVDPPHCGVYIKNLHLRNASWDMNGLSLSLGESAESTTSEIIPIVWFKPEHKEKVQQETSSQKQHVYQCPVYLSSDNQSLDWKYILTHVDLPCKGKPMVWVERKVHLACMP